MLTSVLTAAAVAAVLTPHQVVFVDTAVAAVVRSVPLPGDALAAFAAPDGRIVVPLGGSAGTAVVTVSGAVERWPGRVFPLFFREADRMYVVLPHRLATLSYPERILLERIPLAGVEGARRAACSNDGRLVAVAPDPGGNELVLVPALEEGAPFRVELGGEPGLVELAPDGMYTIVAVDSRSLELVIPGQKRSVRGAVTFAGTVRALAAGKDARDVLVGLAGPVGGEVVDVRVQAGKREPLRIVFRAALAAGVTAVASVGEEIAALSGDDLVMLSGNGRHALRRVSVAGACGLAMVPNDVRTTVPQWSDAAAP